MAGITARERERRLVEDAMGRMERPFRDPVCAVIWVGPVQRGHCAPCGRRDWGAQIRLGAGDEFRCADCLRTIGEALLARFRDAEVMRDRSARAAIEDGSRRDVARQAHHPERSRGVETQGVTR